MEIVEKLLYNDKINEEYVTVQLKAELLQEHRKQWKNACIEYTKMI